MKEKLYTIPVNDAFSMDCECPICQIQKKLETDAVEYTMGPSYMEEDTRSKTDAAGFCEKHIRMIYDQNNRLGMAWVMKTHFDKTISDFHKNLPPKTAKLLKKELSTSPLVTHLDRLNQSCYICDRIELFFSRYMETIFFLYKSDEHFRTIFQSTKGFCTPHYTLLLKMSPKHLKGTDLEDFVEGLNQLYISNMERVRDDLAWFINKFDYSYQNEPWYNAKDSVIRSMNKTNSVLFDEKK